jgi:hypothetical protein
LEPASASLDLSGRIVNWKPWQVSTYNFRGVVKKEKARKKETAAEKPQAFVSKRSDIFLYYNIFLMKIK